MLYTLATYEYQHFWGEIIHQPTDFSSAASASWNSFGSAAPRGAWAGQKPPGSAAELWKLQCSTGESSIH